MLVHLIYMQCFYKDACPSSAAMLTERTLYFHTETIGWITQSNIFTTISLSLSLSISLSHSFTLSLSLTLSLKHTHPRIQTHTHIRLC